MPFNESNHAVCWTRNNSIGQWTAVELLSI